MLTVSVAGFAQMSEVVTAEMAAKSAMREGAMAPEFTLSDSNGKQVSSTELLKQGDLVVVFYRGAWCPFCNKYLNTMQKRAADIKAAGGNVVAISAENADSSMATAKKNELQFPVLSDTNLDTARKFGIVYQLAAAMDEKYRSMGLDLAMKNGMKKPELPLAATYIINKKGIVTYAFIETDYKKRAEPDDLIAAIKKSQMMMMGDDKMMKSDDKMMKSEDKMMKPEEKMMEPAKKPRK